MPSGSTQKLGEPQTAHGYTWIITLQRLPPVLSFRGMEGNLVPIFKVRKLRLRDWSYGQHHPRERWGQTLSPGQPKSLAHSTSLPWLGPSPLPCDLQPHLCREPCLGLSLPICN